MKPRTNHGRRPFQLKLLHYGNCYYIERIARLEAALARRPRVLHLDLIGAGEIPADSALIIRSLLRARPARTRLVTHARSSLKNGAVLVWLLGDTRLIRDDARVYFRRADLPDPADTDDKDSATPAEPNPWTDTTEIEPDEGDHARVLEFINEYLPVKELAGRLVELPVLRQFGLVEHEQVDHFLANAFGRAQEPVEHPVNPLVKKRVRVVARRLKK